MEDSIPNTIQTLQVLCNAIGTHKYTSSIAEIYQQYVKRISWHVYSSLSRQHSYLFTTEGETYIAYKESSLEAKKVQLVNRTKQVWLACHKGRIP